MTTRISAPTNRGAIDVLPVHAVGIVVRRQHCIVGIASKRAFDDPTLTPVVVRDEPRAARQARHRVSAWLASIVSVAIANFVRRDHIRSFAEGSPSVDNANARTHLSDGATFLCFAKQKAQFRLTRRTCKVWLLRTWS